MWHDTLDKNTVNCYHECSLFHVCPKCYSTVKSHSFGWQVLSQHDVRCENRQNHIKTNTTWAKIQNNGAILQIVHYKTEMQGG